MFQKFTDFSPHFEYVPKKIKFYTRFTHFYQTWLLSTSLQCISENDTKMALNQHFL